MDRIVLNNDIYSMVFAPPDFNERAQRMLEALPDEWHTVVVRPYVRDGEYRGAEVHIYDGLGEGGRYYAFLLDPLETLLKDNVRDSLLRKVRHAFEHPEGYPRMPRTEWRVGS